MVSKTVLKRQFNALLEKYMPAMRREFMAALQNMADDTDIAALTRAIKSRDLDAAADAIHLDETAYSGVLEAQRAAFAGAGAAVVASIKTPAAASGQARLVFRFSVRDTEAEKWLSTASSTLVTNLEQQQREAIRVLMESGLAQGKNPRATALDLVGRISKTTGKRTGGVLGLSSPQMEYYTNARAELATASPQSLRNYLSRQLRNRNYDAAVKRALATGQPISAAKAEAALKSYSNRLLKYRADVVAMHETKSAIEGSKLNGYKQAARRAGVKAKKTWRHFGSENPRKQHEAMDGDTVDIDQDHILPDGTHMAHPHAVGAPINQTANCHCMEDYSLDFLSRVRG